MKRPRFPWQVLLWLAGVLFCPATVDAAAASRLVYGRATGTAVCPDESELRAAVRARLGYDPFFPWADQTVVVHVASRPSRRLSGKVWVVNADGRASPEREFTANADECSELVLALALAIVITLDPLHGTTAVPVAALPAKASVAAGESAVTPAARSNDTAVAPVASPPVHGTRPDVPSATQGSATVEPAADRGGRYEHRLVNLDAGGGAIAAAGTMPGVSAGFVPFLRARRGDVSLAVEGRFEVLAVSEARVDHANVSLAGGTAVPCFHFGAVVGCTPLLLARYRAQGVDAAPKEASAVFAAAGIRMGLEIPVVAGAAGFVRAEGLVNLTRHDLLLAGASFWQVPAVSFTLSAGVLASIL